MTKELLMSVKNAEANYRRRLAQDEELSEIGKRKCNDSNSKKELEAKKYVVQGEIEIGIKLLQEGCEKNDMAKINSANSVLQASRKTLKEIEEAMLQSNEASIHELIMIKNFCECFTSKFYSL